MNDTPVHTSARQSVPTQRSGRRRVMLKLSGEVFGGGSVGVNPDVVSHVAKQIAQAVPAVEVSIVVGGGKVGYYLTKELLAAGHELVLLEKDRARARQIADEVGSIVLARDGCEGQHLAEAGANRASIVAAVTVSEVGS